MMRRTSPKGVSTAARISRMRLRQMAVCPPPAILLGPSSSTPDYLKTGVAIRFTRCLPRSRAALKAVIYRRLEHILDGQDETRIYDRLGLAELRRILVILSETLNDRMTCRNAGISIVSILPQGRAGSASGIRRRSCEIALLPDCADTIIVWHKKKADMGVSPCPPAKSVLEDLDYSIVYSTVTSDVV